MTDNDIIKALECCGCDNYQCDNCPYAYKTCTIYKDSIDLINHQKAEIERLRSMNRAKLATIHDLQIELKTAKSEAVKEFADRLIAVSHPYADTQMVFEIQIKNLVKEMVGVNTINDNKEVKVLTHKVIRVDNLMYDGCEPHWKCTRCGKCVPFHCYTKEQFENQDCRPSFTDNSSRK